MAPRHAILQAAACDSIPSYGDPKLDHSQPQQRTLYVHPNDARALVEPTRDGNDYIRVCAHHQWAALPVTRFVDLGECPECVAEINGHDGRWRYGALHAANVRIVGTV